MSLAERIEIIYSCKVPEKLGCDLFVMLGTSLMNGYSASYIAMDSELAAYYFPEGDQTYAQRYGTPAQGYATPKDNVGQFIYMNTAYNYTPGSGRFGPDTILAKELHSKYGWERPHFYFHYEQNGASLLPGESNPDWTPAGTIYPLMIQNLARCVDVLRSMGFMPRISVMWGSAAATNTTDTAYRDAINAIIGGINAACGDNAIRYLWGKPTIQGGAPAIAYRNGVDMVVASNPLVESFDYDNIQVGGDKVHPTTMAVLVQGTLYAGHWSRLYRDNNPPTVINVQITGTLKSGMAIGVTYMYQDDENDTENTTVVGDTLRLREGTGTRVDYYSADDANGTNVDFLAASRNKGETFTLYATTIGKYIQAYVYPKASTGTHHGMPVKSAWHGPVQA